MIAFGANRIGAVYAALSNVEVWARRITGILFSFGRALFYGHTHGGN